MTIGSPLVPSTGMLPLPPPGGTRLIELADDRQLELTSNRETDCRGALTRGLAEYVQQLVIDWGILRRQLKFVEVKIDWSSNEEPAQYPSAAVFSEVEGAYDMEGRFTPKVTRLSTGETLLDVGEFVTRVTVDLWAIDIRERQGLVAMLEDAFNPVEWMTGFRLELPHYHGVRSTWECIGSQYLDAPAEAQQRARRAQFILGAKVSQIRMIARRPDMQGRIKAEAQNAPLGDQPGTVVG